MSDYFDQFDPVEDDYFSAYQEVLPEPEKEKLSGWENFYRASGIHGANAAFANLFGFGPHVQEANKKAAEARKTHPVATGIGGLAADVYGSIPFFMAGGAASKAIPGIKNLGTAGKFGKYLQNIVGTGIGGASIGAVRATGEDETKFGNISKDALIASLVESIMPALKYGFKAVPGTYKYGTKLFGNKSEIANEMFSDILPGDINAAQKSMEAAKRLGVNLTPAEATGNPIIAATEGQLGATKQGARDLTKYKLGEKAKQKQAINTFLDDVSQSKNVAGEEIRDAAKAIIEKDRQAMIAKATPYYKSAEKETLNPNSLNAILRDSNVAKAWDDVLKDPLYATELEGFPKNSIKVLDQVKKNLDGKIQQQINFGDNEAAAILMRAKEKLVSQLDKISPTYAKARKIYGSDAEVLEKLRSSNIGKISNISDINLKNVSKNIFDPQQTDIKVLEQVRDRIVAENPEAWQKIIRNEMERRLDSKTLGKTANAGSNFYDKILSNERDFKQFHAALEGNPKAQQKLTDMRDAFKNLLNSYSAKTSKGLSETSMNKPRSSGQWWERMAKKIVGGEYDRAAIELITNPEWESKFLPKINKNSTPKEINEFVQLLETIRKEGTEKVPHVLGIETSRNEKERDN